MTGNKIINNPTISYLPHLLYVQMLSWRKTFVEVGVERGENRLYPGPVDKSPRLQSVQTVFSEGFDHVPDVDVMQESPPLDVSQFSSRSVRCKPNIIVFL